MSFYGLGEAAVTGVSGARNVDAYNALRVGVMSLRGQVGARVLLSPESASALMAEISFWASAWVDAEGSNSATVVSRRDLHPRIARAAVFAGEALVKSNEHKKVWARTVIAIVEVIEESKRVLQSAINRREPVTSVAQAALAAAPPLGPDEVPRPPTNVIGDILASPVTPIVGLGVVATGIGLWLRSRV
jgi:hypothetical protein